MSKAFKEWYAENKQAVSQKRKERYQNDPEYRQKVLARAAAHREKTGGESIPHGYSKCFADAAEHLGITLWQLRWWREKNYFPEPHDHQGKKWFTENQLALIGQLQSFLSGAGRRINRSERENLESLISLIYGNWGT